MSSADLCLQRAHAYLQEARDIHVSTLARVEALDAARAALLDAHRARAPSAQILPHFTALCEHAASERAHPLRAVLPAAVEDLVARDMPSFAQAATPFLARALHDDNFIVAARAVKSLTRLFRKVVGFVVASGVGDGDGRFSQANVAVWLQMQQKALSLIAAKDEGLRKACVKFAETVVLAFTFSGSAGSPDHFTLDYLVKKGSDCPLLEPRALEEEGIRCVKAIAQLVHHSLEGSVVTARPDGRESVRGLPPMSLMTAISVLSNLVRRRRKILEFTLPPFLNAVAAIASGSRPPTTPQGILQLTPSQRHSIIHVLRFNLLALRPYPHTRSGRAGADIMQASADLEALEREEEMQRRERASKLAAISARERAEREAAVEADKRRAAAGAAAAHMQPAPSMRRGREPTSMGPPWPRLPPKEAYAVAQAIIQSKPPHEVVNFIISALLHHIPPAETVPGAKRPLQKSRATVEQTGAEEPAMKRPRKSRFGAKDPDRPMHEAAPPPPKKKVAVVRKVAPAVGPVKLTSTTVEKIVTVCCRRILKKEPQAIASGAGPMRIQLLARLLTRLSQQDQGTTARQFCEEVCAFIAANVEYNMPLAQAWLFKLACEAELTKISHNMGSDIPLLKTEAEEEGTNRAEKSSEDTTAAVAIKTQPVAEVIVKSELVTDSSATAEVASAVQDKEEAPETKPNAKAESEVVKDDKVAKGDSNPAVKTDQEMANDASSEELEADVLDPLSVNEGYGRIFHRLLELLADKQPFVGDSYSQVICEAPILTQSVFDTLKTFCHDPSRIKIGLHTLRDIVLKRPGDDRAKCLSLLLGFTNHEDEVLRGPSIRLVANKIFAECVGEVPEAIEKHAVDSLSTAIGRLSEKPTADELSSVERASLLLTALCGQKHELLREIAASYISMQPAARHILLQRAKDLAGHLGMAAVPVILLIAGELLPVQPAADGDSSGTDGLEVLALEVLRALLKKFGRPTEEIVDAARTRYDLSGNTAFVIAVLPGLRKDSLLKYLAAIVSSVFGTAKVAENGSGTEKIDPTDDTSKTAGFKEIIAIVMGSRPPALSPSELLFELHNIEPNPAVSSAIRACFELKSIYKQEVIAQAIQQLIEKTVIPDLLMRTVHLARIYYSELEKYLTGTVLKRLIDKHVWKNEILWEGFLIYCAQVKDKSFIKLLLSLPAPQLAEALRRQEDLLTTFKGLFSNPKNLRKVSSVKHRKVIQAAIKKPAKDS